MGYMCMTFIREDSLVANYVHQQLFRKVPEVYGPISG